MKPMLQRPGLVGRAAELALLNEELESAGRGDGRCVVIRSDPGVGKTRLLGEFLLTAKRRALVLSARAYPLGTTTPFALITDALEDHLRTLPASELELVARESAVLGSLLPSLALVSVPASETSRQHVLEGLTRLFQDLAASRPVVLALDDVHLADPSTWEAFHHLARHAATHRLLILVALRSEALAATPSVADLIGTLVQDWVARELVLAPLDRSAIWELARRALGRDDVPATVAEWLFQKTLGNPFYTMGYLQALSERGGDLDPSALGAVPDTLRRRVGARVANLSSSARGALEAAAVIGQRASPALMAAVAGLPASELTVLLDDLVARRLLDDETGPSGLVYDFVHPLVQESVYATIGPLRRRQLHLMAARADVAAGRLAAAAVHFARGAEPGDPEALKLILQAAHEAESQQSHHEAVAHLSAALTLTTDLDERRQLLDELAWQAGQADDFTAGIPALRELERMQTGSADVSARVLTKLHLASLLLVGLGDRDQAQSVLAEAEQLAAESGDALLQTRALNERSWLVGIGGDLAGQIDLARRALAGARDLREKEAELYSLGSLGHALLATGRLDEGAAAVEAGLALAREAHDFAQIVWYGSQVAWVHALRGELDAALALFRSLRREVPESHQRLLCEYSAFCNWLAGRWDDAAKDSEIMVGTWSPAGLVNREVWAYGTAVGCLAEMGRTGEAASVVTRVQRREPCEFLWMTAWYRHSLGILDRAEGRPEEALVAVEIAARALEAMGAIAMAPMVWLELADTARDLRDLARAAQATEALERAAATLGPAWYSGLAALARAWLAEVRGVPSEALDAAQAATSILAGSPFTFYAARAWETRGRIKAAADDLAMALSVYRQLPAPARAERALRLLDRLGSEGRRLASRARGAASLSPRERAVATLAARGLTAKEIAQRLFIGERTVESHLASTYAKLGLASKRELVSRARELQLDSSA